MMLPRPAFLVVADYAAETWTVEGPTRDHVPWDAALKVAAAQGRTIAGSWVDHLTRDELDREGIQHWGRQLPSGLILSLDARASA